ncbi:a2710008-6f4f-4e4e-ac1a-a3f749e2d085 [Thermothielavioides terrestris]|uniref:J domain-containing protein n=2 Tax=Thermothielavioides terrestris TaxID=2587410 RepID=G2R994_THETT|nr:uncharacterized protein THITE_2119966 [Thermothielavioides terrestris NRRL 8126]AEO69492.1 hypothetical protein THITE_2119966 [Thermothielavioides terrestris NRRL 8126]SPQ26007.1 a2710008-6f4f-4e4e-ac1a-a3f749e2d085 [Thermothielavioides terrestris]
MADKDLIAYARDAASRGDDLFALLATDATASESDIRRAFRRKALTAHPDKAGDAYDPALYERLERARDVLLNPEAREAYDSGMRAVLQKKAQLEQMTLKRRQLVEELERREEEAKRAKTDAGPRAYDAERAAMVARGRAKMEEMRRLREEAEVRERLAREKRASTAAAGESSARSTSAGQATTTTPTTTTTTTTTDAPHDGQPTPPQADRDDYDERIAELERRLKEKQQRKAEKEQRKADKKAARKAGSPGREAPPPPSNNPPPPHPSAAADSQADEDKVSEPANAAPAAPPPPPAAGGSTPKTSDRFASTLARLRAAQAKKEEEKRRKAEEEARAAAAGVSAS